MFLFLAIVIGISLLLHGFLYARLVAALGITSLVAKWLLRLVALVLALSYILVRLWERTLPDKVALVLHAFSSVWLGLMWELVWLTLAAYLIKIVLIAGGIWLRFDAATTAAIGRSSVVAVVSAALLLSGFGMWQALGRVRVAHVQVPVASVTPELRELRLVMASDFHAGTLVGAGRVRCWVRRVMELKPDAILLCGDILDRSAHDLTPLVEAFAELKAPLGVFATAGNHEYYAGLDGAKEFLRRAGIPLLMNERVPLPGGLILAGLTDRTALRLGHARPTVAQFLASTARERPLILLTHTPHTEEVQAAARAGADLILCGHTHRGQLWPFTYFSRLAYPYFHGLYAVGESYVYTSSGVGFWGPPMRLGAPPEIVLVRFVGRDEPARVEWRK